MAFVTTYCHDYTKKPIRRNQRFGINDYEEFDQLPEGGNWLTTKMDMHLAMDKVQEMYAKRYVSSYRDHYQWKTKDTPTAIIGDVSDALQQHCDKIHRKNKVLVLPPNATARLIHGYMSPKYFLTDLTTYEVDYGSNACKIIYGENLDQPRPCFKHKKEENVQNIVKDVIETAIKEDKQ